MSDDAAFVQSCADRLGVGWATASLSLKEMANFVFQMLGTRDITDVDHLKRLFSQSAYTRLLGGAKLNTEEEQRLCSILMQHK